MRKRQTYYVQLQPRGVKKGENRPKAGIAEVEARFAFEAKDKADDLSTRTQQWYVIGTADEIPEPPD